MAVFSNRYMQFEHRNARDAVMASFGSRQTPLSVLAHNVKILDCTTEADCLRSQALHSANTVIKKHGAAVDKTVKICW